MGSTIRESDQKAVIQLMAFRKRGWISLTQLANTILNISPQTARRLCNEGKIKCVQVGGVSRVYNDEILRIVQEMQEGSGLKKGADQVQVISNTLAYLHQQDNQYEEMNHE